MLQFVEVLSSIRICEYSKYWMLKFHFSTRNAFDQHNLWERALQGRSPASQLNLQGHNMWNRGIVEFCKHEMWGPHCGRRCKRRRGRGCRNAHIWCKNNLDGGQDLRGECTAAFWLFFLSFYPFFSFFWNFCSDSGCPQIVLLIRTYNFLSKRLYNICYITLL